jgi:hypothetical protein
MFRAVTAGFFDTFGVRFARGRSLTLEDHARGVRVAMVNERFADRLAGSIASVSDWQPSVRRS